MLKILLSSTDPHLVCWFVKLQLSKAPQEDNLDFFPGKLEHVQEEFWI